MTFPAYVRSAIAKGLTKALPDLPSPLIRLALKDLREIEGAEGYRVNMNQWHSPFDSVCRACLAGGVIAGTLCVPPNRRSYPEDWPKHVNAKLRALNCFRVGDVSLGLDWMELVNTALERLLRKGLSTGEINAFMSRYHIPYAPVTRALLHAQLEQLADDLEEIGL